MPTKSPNGPGLVPDPIRKMLQSYNSGKVEEPKSLIALFSEHHLLIWFGDESCIYKLESQRGSWTLIDVLALTSPPVFDVDCLLLSATGRYLAVAGVRGINVVELPRKWGPKLATDDATATKTSILCRSWALSDRLFVCNRRITLLESRWHPASENDQHIVLLTNDNALRIFDVTEPQVPLVHTKLSDAALYSDLGFSAFANSLGDSAISFDFGPPVAKYSLADQELLPKQDCLWPIYVLRGNGDILIFYHSLASNKCHDIKLIGPLTMLPAAEDNYGTDACKLACLDTSPPMLVIATSSGLVYHCISLGSADYGYGGNGSAGADDTISELHGTSVLDLPKPTLYVYESVELALSLTQADETDITCPIRIYKDPISADRYYLTHGAGLHAIHLPVVGQLSSSDLSSSEPCIVEHLVCTRPLASSLSKTEDCPVTLGLTIGWRNGSTCLNLILSSGELITQSLTPLVSALTIKPSAAAASSSAASSSLREDVAKIELTEHINQILKRSANVPTLLSRKDLKATGDELLQLVLNTTQVLKQEYLQKQELAAKALEKRVRALSNEKQVQLLEFARCADDKTAIIEAIKHLTSKYDSVLQKQRLLSDRLEKVLDRLHQSQSALSDAERNMSVELRAAKDKVQKYRDGMNHVESKYYYQKDALANSDGKRGLGGGVGGGGGQPAGANKSSVRGQLANVKNMLENEGTQIQLLLQRINHLKEQADNH